MYTNQAKVDPDKKEWHGPVAKESLVADLKKTLQKVLPASDVLPVSAKAPARRHSVSRATPSIGMSVSPPALPALPSPATIRFVLLCGLWYTCSALSSNTGKGILNQFQYPITLTFVQFGFVAGYCLLFMSPIIRFSRLRKPTRANLKDTLYMGMFQVGGHIFSSMAISRIPVSTTHTIKALSPLFTVAAYALLFGVRYSAKTYVSLMPLTLGVMLACTFDMSASDAIGLLCAFGSALIFVSSNIFFKKIMPSNGDASSSHHKLDKLNLLFYSSSMAFLLMIPIWLYTDLPAFLAASEPGHVAHPSHGHSATHSVSYYFLANGTVHFAQNIIAFIILSSVSPVTYSIASLIKRVAVICMAILWFNQQVHPVQGCGIALTFAGLWMYNNAKGDVERGESKRRGVEARREGMLPSTRAEEKILAGAGSPPPERTPVAAVPETGTRVVSASSRARGVSLTAPYAPASPLRTKMHMHTPLHEYSPQMQMQMQSRNPNLHIEIDAVHATEKGAVMSPTEHYPSPPPSLDSPPLTASLAPIAVQA
ncbi:TPT-domain-containing protein [Dentipellis sp. KUC8613]|nr:TPT-domain-containing protein [Dentipellis sp. KUC8613]